MGEIEVFDGGRLVEIATCHHPINALPGTLTGLGRLFLGVAQLRAQNKLFELEARQLQYDREYKIALVSAQKELGLATLESRRAELAARWTAESRQDALRALEIQAKSAEAEQSHRQKLLLIEDSYRLARLVLRQRDREVRHQIEASRDLLGANAEATRGVRNSLAEATRLMVRPGQTLVQEQLSQATVTTLASLLSDLGTSAARALGQLLDSSSKSAELAFQGIYEVRSR